MTPGEEFRTYMKAANRDRDDAHLNEATAIAYYRGELSETERETAQSHLVTCSECIALLRSVSDFLEPASSDDEEVTEAETDQQWRSFLHVLKSSSPVVRGNFKPSRVKTDSHISLALAASLLISLGAAGWFAWSYSQERQSRRQSEEVAAQLQSRQRGLEKRLESDADQVKREREQRLAAEAERDRFQELLAAVQPQTENFQVYSFTLVSERGASLELQLKANTAAEVRLFIGKPGAFAQYEVEILGEGGRSVRKFGGLRPKGVLRTLNFRLNRGSLSPGKYRLRLSARQGSTTTQLGEYDLRVN